MLEKLYFLVSLDSDIAIKSDSAKLLSVIVDLQEHILSMPSKYSELLQSENDLKKKLVEIESWDKEKSNYELTEISHSVFVFSSKKCGDSSSPSHWLCANCYHENHKSILQFDHSNGVGSHYICHKCKSEICVHSKEYLSSYKEDFGPRSGGGPNSWMGS